MDSIEDMINAIHAFFEHLTSTGDVTDAAYDYISSVTDLHNLFSDYAGSHTVLSDDVVNITDAFAQHGVPHTLAQHLAETTYHSSNIDNVEIGRNAARNTLKLANDFIKAHGLTFGGETSIDGQPDWVTGNEGSDIPLPASEQLRFEGGLWPTLPILEVQIKADCMAQMLEKLAQLYHSDAWGVNNTLQNHLADHIQEYAMEHNPGFFQQVFLGEEDWGRISPPDPISHLRAFMINPAKATDILRALGVDSHWSAFNHATLVSELNAHKPVGVILDAQYLPGYSSGFAPHAITLTGTYNDPQGHLMYYGIDTNVRQVCIWTADKIEKAVEAYAHRNLESYYAGKVLLLDHPVKYWPYIMA